MAEERVECRTPNPGKPGITRIPKWKFDAVRAAILEVLRDRSIADLASQSAGGARYQI